MSSLASHGCMRILLLKVFLVQVREARALTITSFLWSFEQKQSYGHFCL